MKYYITTSEQAHGISAIKAQQQGCTGTTSFWWPVITHPTTGEAALRIGDEECELATAVFDEEGVLVTPAETVKTLYENGLNEITTADLQPEEYMIENGWFSEIV